MFVCLQKFDAERIQMLTKENETLKCELYHIKKMRSEVQSEGETNSGVFLKQIESLRNENNRLNEYLKQTEIQVKQLENQVSFSQSTIIYKKTYNLNSLF